MGPKLTQQAPYGNAHNTSDHEGNFTKLLTQVKDEILNHSSDGDMRINHEHMQHHVKHGISTHSSNISSTSLQHKIKTELAVISPKTTNSELLQDLKSELADSASGLSYSTLLQYAKEEMCEDISETSPQSLPKNVKLEISDNIPNSPPHQIAGLQGKNPTKIYNNIVGSPSPCSTLKRKIKSEVSDISHKAGRIFETSGSTEFLTNGSKVECEASSDCITSSCLGDNMVTDVSPDVVAPRSEGNIFAVNPRKNVLFAIPVGYVCDATDRPVDKISSPKLVGDVVTDMPSNNTNSLTPAIVVNPRQEHNDAKPTFSYYDTKPDPVIIPKTRPLIPASIERLASSHWSQLYQICEEHKYCNTYFTDVMIFKCDFCPKKSHRFDILYEHTLGAHEREEVISCELCGKQFKYRDWVYKQEEINADVCEDEFGLSGGLLSTHTFSRIDLKPFKCELCGKLFKTYVYLRKHKRHSHLPR